MSNGDPIGSDKPRGKSNAKRMGRYDGSFTPTEQRKKDKLMRQFMKTGEGVGGNSEAYRNAQCWCACGRLKMTGRDECLKCLEAAVDAPLQALRNEAAERKYGGAVGCMGAPLGSHPASESVTPHYASGHITVVSDPRMEGSPPLVLQFDDVRQLAETWPKTAANADPAADLRSAFDALKRGG